MAKINVLIPVLNEEQSIVKVLADVPTKQYDIKVIVADNGSTDNTPTLAKENGATVVFEPQRGYGAACLKAMEVIDSDCEIVVFLDGDYSDYPQEMELLIEPILKKDYDMVIGSRIIGNHSKGALLPQAIFGNWLASFLIKLFWKFRYTDLGPFRAIKKASLEKINMQDRNFGWTVEMQIRVLKHKLKILEVPVSYRKRIGKSKISGTVTGSFKAGVIILKTIFKEFIFS